MSRLGRMRLREILFTLGLGLATALAVPACGDKNLQAIEVPTAGVRLQYDFTPGQRYRGRVRRSEAVQSSMFTINRSIECNIDLTVLGEDPNRGDILVSAVVSNVDISWKLPPSSPMSIDAVIKQALGAVQGMKVNFNVLPNGKINHMPSPPPDANEQVVLVIDQVLESIESAFMEVPKRSVKQGKSWEEKEKRGRKGKLGSYRNGLITTTMEGLYRHTERKEDVAKLAIKQTREETITTKAGSHQNKWEGKTTALFSTSGNYLAEISGEVRKFDPGTGFGPQTTFTKVQVRWEKLDGTAPVAPVEEKPPEDAEVQAISDPCNPDYVGAEECKEGAETQAITDPCDPDYVGGEECKEGADKPADDTKAGTDKKDGG